ncbi:maintenance of mitochondrial morphology protein 1 [Trametopsis cervina]|nr:maintenance of mitochondrial morphology protein 1 [Trametopsis cervina]
MANAYVFTLQPTFTQGLIIGQFSILFLLVVILKYLFLDPVSDQPYKSSSYQPRIVRDESDETVSLDGLDKLPASMSVGPDGEASNGVESADWINILLHQVVDAYRTKLRADLPGAEGDEVARRRVEKFANKMRPAAFLDPIKVHSVDLGVSAPRLSRARPRPLNTPLVDPQIEVDMDYTDTISISFSTSVLLNYPFPSFARLPISLTISLSLFSSTILLTPPQPHSPHPTLTVMLPSPQSDFTLDLKTTSLMGSRAKLADVPKLHELITNQIRRVIAEKGIWRIVLPGLASVEQVKEDVQKEWEAAEAS